MNMRKMRPRLCMVLPIVKTRLLNLSLQWKESSICFLLVITLLSCGREEAHEGRESTNLNTFVQGEGSPTVVFESGLGTPLNNWAQIQAGISDQYQTISYDRRGIGASPDSDDPRTLEHYVKDLHQVLAENEIDGPIVLVGHSLGGHIVRKYQATFPSKVVGLFLIDPTHEDLYDAVFEEMSEAAADSMKTAWDESFKKGAVGVFKEWEEAYSNDEKMRDCPLPGDIPITILASYQESTFLTETNRRLKKKCFSPFYWEYRLRHKYQWTNCSLVIALKATLKIRLVDWTEP